MIPHVLSCCTQAHYSLGAVAQSFTSTTHAPVTENEAAIVDRDILRYRLVKSKGAYSIHVLCVAAYAVC